MKRALVITLAVLALPLLGAPTIWNRHGYEPVSAGMWSRIAYVMSGWIGSRFD